MCENLSVKWRVEGTDCVLFSSVGRLVFEAVTQHVVEVTKLACRPLDLDLQPLAHCCVFPVTDLV